MMEAKLKVFLSVLFVSMLLPVVNALAADVKVPAGEIKKLIVGRTVSCGPSKCTYNKDGSYRFNRDAPGKYTISNGKICVRWENGFARCDSIVRNGKKYFLINARGQRFNFG